MSSGVAKYAVKTPKSRCGWPITMTRPLRRDGLIDLFEQLEVPLVDVLAEMEYLGIRVDGDTLREMQTTFAKRLDEVREEMFAAAGTRFQPRQSETTWRTVV